MKKTTTYTMKFPIYKIIWGNIKRFQYINSISDLQLAEIFEISERTLYIYDKEPFKLTLNKIELFLNNTQITMEQLITI